MVLKNVENKIKLVTIVCPVFLAGCIVISLGSVFTARQMVNDAHKQIYVLDSNVPILVKQTPQEVTLDIEAKADIDMFHHLFFTLTTCFSPLPLMTSISAIPLTRPCTLSMRRDLPSTTP